MSLADMYARMKPAIVAVARIEEQSSKPFRIFGSGFCVDSEGIIVTARHVITGYYEDVMKAPIPKHRDKFKKPLKEPGFSIVFFRKEKNRYGAVYSKPMSYIFPLQGEHPEDDVAVLRMPKCPDFWGGAWPSLKLGDIRSIREGDDVATCGYPLKWEPIESDLPNLTKGIVSRVDEKIGNDNKWEVAKLVLSMYVNPGNSGGPVFDARSGKVIGLISSERVRDPDEIPAQLKGLFQIPTGIVYCIPLGLIDKAISALKSAETDTSKDKTVPRHITGITP